MNESTQIFDDIVVTRPAHLGAGSWRITHRTPITIIFGKNGSGKSLLLRGIRNQNNELNHYSVPERAGNISFQIQNVTSQLSGDQRASRANQNLYPEYRQDVISRIQAFLMKRGSVRKTIDSESLTEIEKRIHDILPDFEFNITGSNPPYSLIRKNTEKVTDVSQLSSGESELFALGLDLLLICNIWKFEEKIGTLLIDEPDTHIHPDLQQRFAKFLVNLHETYQCPLIIATHSTTLLAALGFYGGNKTSVIYLDNSKEEQKTIHFNKYLETIATCLGGHALMGPLFNFPLLLVEGDDDFRIWSELPRHSEVMISVIPCGGDEIYQYQKMLEKLFSSIVDSQSVSGFALLDGDKTIPEVPQNHIKFLKLNCHESENLYLTDENLGTMGLTWEKACRKVIEKSNEYGQKASDLKSIESWDRKKRDCKNVINEVAKILDERNLLWSQCLGKTLSKEKPTGQLAEFLGSSVVDTFWKTN